METKINNEQERAKEGTTSDLVALKKTKKYSQHIFPIKRGLHCHPPLVIDPGNPGKLQ